MPANKRKTLLEDGVKEDGEFWMSIEDMTRHFTNFEACSVSVDTLTEDDSGMSTQIHSQKWVEHCFMCTVKNWNSLVKNGAWEKASKTAGGCRNFPTFVNNPQYVIELDEDDDGDGKCSCIIALMQKNRRKQKKLGVQDLCIGYSVYKVSLKATEQCSRVMCADIISCGEKFCVI